MSEKEQQDTGAPLVVFPERETSALPTTFRIATLNVHGWHSEHGEDSFPALITLLKSLNLDIIALQEAPKHRLPQLVAALDQVFRPSQGQQGQKTRRGSESATTTDVLHESVESCPPPDEAKSSWQWASLRNCALLSRFPITVMGEHTTNSSGVVTVVPPSSSKTVSKKNRAKHSDDYDPLSQTLPRHCRAFVHIPYPLGGRVINGGPPPHLSLDVVSLHLDHVREEKRLAQIRALFDGLSSETRADLLLVGDFNALNQDDYAPPPPGDHGAPVGGTADGGRDEWDRIAEVRSRNSWEAPRTEVYEWLVRGTERWCGKVAKRKGLLFADCWRRGREAEDLGSGGFSVDGESSGRDDVECGDHGEESVEADRGDLRRGTKEVVDPSGKTIPLGCRDGIDAAPSTAFLDHAVRTTSRFDTRIDYIFAAQPLLDRKLALVSCEHVRCIPKISDHNLVVATFAVL